MSPLAKLTFVAAFARAQHGVWQVDADSMFFAPIGTRSTYFLQGEGLCWDVEDPAHNDGQFLKKMEDNHSTFWIRPGMEVKVSNSTMAMRPERFFVRGFRTQPDGDNVR